VFKQRPIRTNTEGETAPGAVVTRTSPAYWRKRVFKNSYTRAGRRVLLHAWSVKIQYQGHRHTFSLAGATRHAAGLEAKALYDSILAEGWESALRGHSSHSRGRSDNPKNSPDYWWEELVARYYHFPVSGQGELDLGAMVSHAGRGYFFPLGSPERAAAATRACEIYQTIVEQGWETALRTFPRELIVGLEWCSNPSLWTYATIHTLVKPLPPSEPSLLPKALVIEVEAEVRRSLLWCIDQQSGFQSVECDSLESLPRAMARHKPQLLLLNRSLAPHFGFDWRARLDLVAPGVLALPYSLAVDGEYLFAATTGRKEGYVFKRVEPWKILEPIFSLTGELDSWTDDYQACVRTYFNGLLSAYPDDDTTNLAKLTRRELEVFRLLSKGYIDKEIAESLRISFWTVHGYIKSIFAKLRVRTRTEAARYMER
jgi:DNA-binding NarL/FixJ family response regulator